MTILISILMMAAADGVPASNPIAEKPEATVEETGLRQLLTIHRLFVDRLTGGETASQMRDMLVSSLENTKLFIVTENQEKADCFLRGAAEDLVFTDVHSSSEGINARSNIGTSRSQRAGGAYGGGNSAAINGGLGIGETESSHIEERQHEAVAAVRLVNKDGDVIWSTTQESLGGKFHRASTDVADRITKRLIEDYARARKLPAVSPASGSATR
jgi:hypothetical protein